MVEAVISKEHIMYSKLLRAVVNKHDNVILTRLYGAANGNLVAVLVEAGYHCTKNCYSKYINITKY